MTSTKHKTYEDIKYRIITQKLAPGELLKDKEIMARYGIGRTPLREIFLELQNEGLINRVPRSGTWVAPMDFNFLKQITEIRIGLEGVAAELACQRISKDQIQRLTQILDQVDNLDSETSMSGSELLKSESEIHNIIYNAANNPQLEKLLRHYQSLGARFWHYLVFSPTHMTEQFQSHRQLLNALNKHDSLLCKSIAEAHINVYIDIIEQRVNFES